MLGTMCGRDNGYGYVQLRDSIERGNRLESIGLLERGARVNGMNPTTQTPLHYAVENNDVEIVKMLLKRNARVNAVNCESQTPLHLAVSNKNVEICTLLIQHGASVFGIDSNGQKKKKKKKKRSNGQTPLHIAVSNKHVEICTLLIQHGASVLQMDNLNRSPLSFAIVMEHIRMVEILVEKAPLSCTDDIQKCCVHLFQAINSNRLEIVQMILNKNPNVSHKDPKSGKSSLHFALMKCNLGVVSKLLEHGAQVNDQDNDGKMSLHIAAVSKFNEHTINVVELLLQYGANSDIPDNQGQLPMHVATECGNYQIIQYLLQHGSTVDPVVPESTLNEEKRGFTPLFFGILNKSITTIGVLLRSGANVNAKTSNGTTVLCTAVQTMEDHIVKEILKYNPDVHDEGNKKSLELVISLVEKNNYSYYGTPKLTCIVNSLVQYGFTISSEGVQSISLLFYAVRNRCVQVVDQLIKKGANLDGELNGKCVLELTLDKELIDMAKLLIGHGAQVKNKLVQKAVENCKTNFVDLFLQHGADPNLLDENGRSILNTCILKHKGYRSYTEVKKSITDIIIKNGANVNMQDQLGNAPIHVAVENEDLEMIEHLIQRGSDVNIPDKQGRLPLHIAVDKSQYKTIERKEKIIECLIKSGGLVDATVLAPQLNFQETNFTPLLFAIQRQCLPSVKVLLKSGACVNVKVNSNGCTVLFAAVQTKSFEIVKEILKYKPDITDFDNKESFFLAVCGSEKSSILTVNSLLDNGLVVDATFVHDVNFIVKAVNNGHVSTVGQLLERGANVNSKDSNNKSILYIAVEKNNLKMVEEILKYKPDVNEVSSNALFTIAVSRGGEQSELIVDTLLDYGFSINSESVQDKTFIFNAVKKNHLSMVVHLLNAGMNVNIKDSNGCSILYTAVGHSNLKMVQAILKYKPDVKDKSNMKSLRVGVFAHSNRSQFIVENLLEYGFPITSKNKQDEKFMLDAISNCHLKVVDLLIKRGANVNAEINRRCLLEVAFDSGYQYGMTGMAELLIENGAQIKNELLKEAILTDKAEFVDLFLQHGADANYVDENGSTLLHNIADRNISTDPIFISLLKYGARINSQTKQGNTVLHLVCKGGYDMRNCVLVLCEHGAQVDIENESGETALHLAVKAGNLTAIKALLDHGANIHYRDHAGQTPLHFACSFWINEVIKFLIEHGARVDSKDNNGESALQVSIPISNHLEEDLDTFNLMLNCSSKNIRELIKTTELLMMDSQRSRIGCILVKHIIKLRELQFHDKEDDVQIQRVLEQLTDTIDEKEWTTFVTQCSKEVVMIKKESIGSTNISHYNFLRKTCHKVTLCLKNKSIHTYLEQSDLKTRFPIYATMIENQYKQGQIRLNLLTKVNSKRLFPELLFDCVQEILGYLDIEDFHALVRVFPSARNVSEMENQGQITGDKDDMSILALGQYPSTSEQLPPSSPSGS